MQLEFKDFVGIYKDFLDKDSCESFISAGEHLIAAGYSKNRLAFEGAPRHEKDDVALFSITELPLSSVITEKNRTFLSLFWSVAFKHYAEEYSVLQSYDRHGVYYVKFQKTLPGQGYHVWHSEDSAREVSNRIASFILYLNTVEEGGETEFLYQKFRVKPEQGTLILFPAGYTHTHRGNPPLSNEKYIITGWVEF